MENNHQNQRMDSCGEEAAPIRLHISEIDYYDRNPRKALNPEFESIKNSIFKHGGLTTALSITRRPGGDRYIVAAGGNTRLAVLKALFEETKDERFGYVITQFHPWLSESAVLCQHLIENNLRAPMTFIDRALAVHEFKNLVEAEDNIQLGRNELYRRLAAAGIPENPRQLTRYAYAVERLVPHLIGPLRANMGAKDVDNLKKLDDESRTVAAANNLSDERYGQLFANTLEAISELSRFRLVTARNLLEGAIADAAGVVLPKADVVADEIPSTVDSPNEVVPPALERSDQVSVDSIPDARQKIRSIATSLAQQFDLQDGITEVDFGFGYAVDVPAKPIETDHPYQLQRMWVWWLLLSFSEQTASRDRLRLLRSNWLRDQMLADQVASVFSVAGRPVWNNVAHQFFSHPDISDSVYTRVIELTTLCRTLRKMCRDELLWPMVS
jgi:ParB family protein of integrating conjugative element (PFGI_1 class)